MIGKGAVEIIEEMISETQEAHWKVVGNSTFSGRELKILKKGIEDRLLVLDEILHKVKFARMNELEYEKEREV